jgi:hypothetical protein
MPIKKSFLEQKWYFRVTKVFFLMLPFLAAIFLFWRMGGGWVLYLLKTYPVYIAAGLVLYFVLLSIIWRIFIYIAFGGLENDAKPVDPAVPAATLPPKQSAWQAIPILIIICVVAITAYKLGYISLPGMNIIDKHIYGTGCQTGGKKGLYGTDGNCYTCSGSTATASRTSNNCSAGTAGVYCCAGAGDEGCIATNCGKMWYCSGSYYIGGQRIDVPGLCYPTNPRDVYPSWSGTCRQCP